MLKKLIKYEWKNTSKVCLMLLLAVGITTLMGILIFQAPMWKSLTSDVGGSDTMGELVLNLVSLCSIFLYVILLVGAIYAVFIYLIVRFYKSMYKSEGYLLHTLPVTKHQILISKILVSTLWVYLVYIAMIVSVGIFLLAMMCSVTGESVTSVIRHFSDFYNEADILFWRLGLSSNIGFSVFWVLAFFNMLLSIPSTLIILFGATSLGQLASKNRVLMAVVSYIGIMFVRWIISSLLSGINYAGTMLSGSYKFVGYMNSSLGISLVVNLLLAVGCYIASYYVISKRLNLE